MKSINRCTFVACLFACSAFLLLLCPSCQQKTSEPSQSVADSSALSVDSIVPELLEQDTIVAIQQDSVEVEPDSTDVPTFKREGNYIYLSKPKMRLYIVNKQDSVLFSCGMACGIRRGDKMAEGDYRTPEGRFRIVGIYESTEWIHKTRDGRMVKGCYGPYFLSLATGKFRGIGIHGTNAPRSIGKRASEGCIRVLTKNIEVIFEHYAFNGMRVVISGERERLPNFIGLGKEYKSAEQVIASLTPEELRQDSLKGDSLPTENIVEPDTFSIAPKVAPQVVDTISAPVASDTLPQ